MSRARKKKVRDALFHRAEQLQIDYDRQVEILQAIREWGRINSRILDDCMIERSFRKALGED